MASGNVRFGNYVNFSGFSQVEISVCGCLPGEVEESVAKKAFAYKIYEQSPDQTRIREAFPSATQTISLIAASRNCHYPNKKESKRVRQIG